jgi:YD repeat-containing protein
MDTLEHAGFSMATDYDGSDRRKEIRYPLEAKVIVRTKNGEATHAMARDISSSGMKLHFAEPSRLAQGEEITVEVELAEYPDRPFSSWGVGRIAYVDSSGAGVQLLGGQFDPGSSPDQAAGELA